MADLGVLETSARLVCSVAVEKRVWTSMPFFLDNYVISYFSLGSSYFLVFARFDLVEQLVAVLFDNLGGWFDHRPRLRLFALP
jgi:hypothetical protein